MHVLDNPIWEAVRSGHRGIAVVRGRAGCYPPDVSPLAGLGEASAAALGDLAAIVPSGAGVGLVGIEGVEIDPALWLTAEPLRLVQMVCEKELGAPGIDPVPLGARDVPEMLALTEATQPGPFAPRTIEMGRYVGLRDGERLVAMAGERLSLDAYTEVSAVCTDPAFRGRGLAEALVRVVGARIQAEGRTPFLHVVEENRGAIALYERLGFVVRRRRELATLLRR